MYYGTKTLLRQWYNFQRVFKKKEKKKIEQRTKLYKLINSQTITQSKKIADLAEIALNTNDTTVRNYNAGIICFLGAYIKRYANFMLLAENENMMSIAELGMAISESLRYLGNVNIPTDYDGNINVKIPTENVIILYEIFEKIVEDSLTSLKAVYVKLDNSLGVVLKLTMEGVSVVLDEDSKVRLKEADISVTIKYEDEITYIRFMLSKGV